MQNITQLESDLWESADQLRANSRLNQTQYSNPVLGLIFLRHATTRFNLISAEINHNLPSRGGVARPLRPDDFTQRAAIFLPEKARYDYLVDLPEGEDVGKAINEAMSLIEAQTPLLQGALPKTYTSFEPDLLRTLLRIFNRDALKTADGDVFGRIYEYFLNKFAQNQALPGGEVFTPPSLVRLIVNIIEPDHGTVFDPAAGSAGMFVQTGYFLQDRGTRPADAVTFYGQEKSDATVNLARMNLAVHGLEGKVVVGNTYYEDLHHLIGRCHFVMANPPFNVDAVNPEKVKKDPRLFTKKSIPGVAQKTGSVSNANYLWIQYFYSYLRPSGRAGFVMASSASDAGHGEREIRRELIETGAVDVMVAIGTNFFYTRSLPCTLWFFDRAKADPDFRPPAMRTSRHSHQSADTVLMIDARHLYRVVTRRINDFSEEQLANLTAITWLYRGQTERYLALVDRYLQRLLAAGDVMVNLASQVAGQPDLVTRRLSETADNLTPDPDAGLTAEKIADFHQAIARVKAESQEAGAALADLGRQIGEVLAKPEAGARDNASQRALGTACAALEPRLKQVQKQSRALFRDVDALLKAARKEFQVHKLPNADKSKKLLLEVEKDWAQADFQEKAMESLWDALYFLHQVAWLQSRFPDGVYADVPGLCKVVTRAEIYAADDSLTPGRYVGIPPIEDDDEIFEERMQQIHLELMELNREASDLGATVSRNFEGLLI